MELLKKSSKETWSTLPISTFGTKGKYLLMELFKIISALPKHNFVTRWYPQHDPAIKTQGLQADFSQNQWWGRALNRAASQLSSALAVCECTTLNIFFPGTPRPHQPALGMRSLRHGVTKAQTGKTATRGKKECVLHHAWHILDSHSKCRFLQDLICQSAATPETSIANEWILWISNLKADPRLAQVNKKVPVNPGSFVLGSK